MQDLRDYSDQELSLLVFNDEYLYTLRANFLALHQAVNELFLFTDEQYDVMAQDVEDDQGE